MQTLEAMSTNLAKSAAPGSALLVFITAAIKREPSTTLGRGVQTRKTIARCQLGCSDDDHQGSRRSQSRKNFGTGLLLNFSNTKIPNFQVFGQSHFCEEKYKVLYPYVNVRCYSLDPFYSI